MLDVKYNELSAFILQLIPQTAYSFVRKSRYITTKTLKQK